MLYTIKKLEELENLTELVSLQNQVEQTRLQDKLSKQKLHEIIEKTFEPVTDTIKNISEKLTKSLTEYYNKNNQALENSNNKLLEILNDRGILSTYLTSPLSKNTIPENFSQFKLVKDHNSNRVNDLLIYNTVPTILYNYLLAFRDTGKEFKLEKDLLKMITNKNYNVDLASLSDRKFTYDSAKETIFDVGGPGDKSIRDRMLEKMLKSPELIVSDSGISNTIFLPSDPDELCDRLLLLLQEKHAGNNSDLFDKGIVAILDQLLESKCISKKQHKQTLFKCNLLHK